MPLDESPGEIVTRERDGIRDKYLQDYSLRIPEADVGPDGQPYVDASTFADAQVLVLNDAVVIGRGTNLRTSAGQWLRDIGEPRGIFPRPAVGATGFVEVTASVGGGTILAGTELFEPQSQLRFRVTATALYTDEQHVPIAGFDTGPSTNLAAGTVLQFRAAPAGIGPAATVVLQTDGSGLSGGRLADDDEAYRQLIQEAFANPPAAGNDAQYAAFIEDSKTHGVAVEKGFIYPAILGAGTVGFVFTLRTSQLGASRIPNAAQIAAVLASLTGRMPADDGIFACTLFEQFVPIALRVSWASGAESWADVTPWPPYIDGDQVVVTTSGPPAPLSFQLATGTTTTDPQIGQTIAFFDTTNLVFRRKRIATVSTVIANKKWDITIADDFNVSDTTYTPFETQAASPYSPSLDSLVAPVLTYFAGLGPGEQVDPFPDPGRRQRRQPESPGAWPNIISNRIISPVQAITTVGDASLLAPTVPYVSLTGTPGVLSYLLALFDLAVYE